MVRDITGTAKAAFPPTEEAALLMAIVPQANSGTAMDASYRRMASHQVTSQQDLVLRHLPAAAPVPIGTTVAVPAEVPAATAAEAELHLVITARA